MPRATTPGKKRLNLINPKIWKDGKSGYNYGDINHLTCIFSDPPKYYGSEKHDRNEVLSRADGSVFSFLNTGVEYETYGAIR